MSRAFDSISKALRQAIAHQRGKRVRGMRPRVPGKLDEKEVRRRGELTQEQLAAKFAVKSPNAVTIAAMCEARSMKRARFSSAQGLVKHLEEAGAGKVLPHRRKTKTA